MYELCSTCLSKHRTRVPLSTIDVDFSLKEMFPFAGPLALVCWECSSRLQNMQAFKSQATKAQELLKLYMETKKPLKTLPSLSRLSISGTKTDYDENIEYCMKEETVEYEEEYLDDVECEVKYDTEIIEHIPKVETIDIQESYQSKSPDSSDNYLRESSSEYLYVMVDPLTASGDNGNHSDDSSAVTKEKDCENDSNIKTEAKNKETEKRDSKLNIEEDNIVIKKMSLKEVYRLRDEDRKHVRYTSCPFRCRNCITGYLTEEEYNAHLLMKHSKDIGPHACDICLTRHARTDELAQHRKTHFNHYHCRQCQFNTHILGSMTSHQTEHETKNKYSCKFCEFSTWTSKRLYYHVDKVHKKRPRPKCVTCLKDFSSDYNYKRHMSVVHGGGATRELCGECGGMFRLLAQHVRQTHAPPGPGAVCADCGRTFNNNFKLRRHQYSRHGQRNDAEARKRKARSNKYFECDDCGHRFKNKFYMAQHIASQHMKRYPYNCDICQKGFLRPDRLKDHVLERHEGVRLPRDHLCSYCGKVFMVKQSLTNHMLTHTEELRPFRCAHCPWSFALRPALRRHMRAQHPGAGTGNTGGAGGSGNTDEGENGGKNEP